MLTTLDTSSKVALFCSYDKLSDAVAFFDGLKNTLDDLENSMLETTDIVKNLFNELRWLHSKLLTSEPIESKNRETLQKYVKVMKKFKNSDLKTLVIELEWWITRSFNQTVLFSELYVYLLEKLLIKVSGFDVEEQSRNMKLLEQSIVKVPVN